MASEQGINVKIKLVSTIIPTDGEQEKVEMWLQGTMLQKAGAFYLRYEEVHEGAEIRTTVKMAEDDSVILRNGAVKMRLPLNTTLQSVGHYESIHGALPIETKTHQLAHIKNGINGSFIAQYDLLIGGASVGNYTLELTYSEVQK